MPRYYCDYCDIFLTHDSATVRKSHNDGWKHKSAVRSYYAEYEPDFYAQQADPLRGHGSTCNAQFRKQSDPYGPPIISGRGGPPMPPPMGMGMPPPVLGGGYPPHGPPPPYPPHMAPYPPPHMSKPIHPPSIYLSQISHQACPCPAVLDPWTSDYKH
ncbi:hypothetical protein PROFUN_13861 [Planoprotostelium fungivorum]|uniref:Matrin-type domain-containing protein n=1 Tax=Planoprotostelium fungivorum TaxID=1890364 RepID=A0A2P6N2T3_9EUKA|nr:hypothetical protein PROFUN_16566 [Planoprotostelium fungivorum]PRP78251.1 hypothetical protein PROFUN_13861 [Planoprotostelium fungivorum]